MELAQQAKHQKDFFFVRLLFDGVHKTYTLAKHQKDLGRYVRVLPEDPGDVDVVLVLEHDYLADGDGLLHHGCQLHLQVVPTPARGEE